MSPLNWKGRPYRPAGSTGYIRVYKPDINELMKPLSQKRGLGSAILTGNAINPQNSPQPQNVTPTPTSSPTVTPSVTPTEPYDIYLFEECNNSSNKFRFEYVSGGLVEGNVYLISGGSGGSLVWSTTTSTWNSETTTWDSSGSGFNGYATVISYSAVGPVYSGTGVTFTQQPNCPGVTPTPTPSITSSPTVTPTQTTSETPTMTPTNTQTSTPTPTNTPSSTPPAFSPSGLTNLQYWFMADSGATASSWTNYGSLGGSISQSTGANQPQVVTGQTLGSYTGTCVQFDSSRDYMDTTHTNTSFSAGTYFFVMDAQLRNSVGWSIFQRTTSGGNTIWDYQNYNNATSAVSRKSPAARTLNNNYEGEILYGASGDTTEFLAQVNDVVGVSGVTTYTASTVGYFSVGYDAGVTLSQTMKIFEIIGYNRKLTSTEYGNVMTYLKNKYQFNTW